MKSWSRPKVPRLPGKGEVPQIWDTASNRVLEATPVGDAASIYVCGITPYDSTHIGHAATYLAYDTLIRLWLDAGLEVKYVQNTTDVDDPLIERAHATGVDWRELAADQTDRFRGDMESLRILPPDHFVAVTDRVSAIADAVGFLLQRDIAYPVDSDYYFDSAAASATAPWHLGDESHFDRATMLALSAERGGDPDRPGKRDALDPLLWRGARDGDPSWESALGAGRPGWHIECSVIVSELLDLPITVQGGGVDLIFPHHEFTAGHTAALAGEHHAAIYSHAGLVAYEGEKMSKSRGNLVFVSQLTAGGIDPRAIRLVLLAQHYRNSWEWTDALLAQSTERLARWEAWAANPVEGSSTLLRRLRAIIPRDLDTQGAVAAIDELIESGARATSEDIAAIDALLGVAL
ncbi:MAG: L-cysteine:1D-myo-inositol 2-amino-2-deoxy-alpha-D-glucopyranoside ligase [Actinomycetota bacterium]|nr:L-cysteine:1D-myo-inositol 2-amino-2-deoxy-alpha-D-glucopyranoside ligase [Actinomycetota bacterium]